MELTHFCRLVLVNHRISKQWLLHRSGSASNNIFCDYRDLDFSLDISRMNFPDDFFEKMQPKIEKAFAAMRELGGRSNRQSH